MYGWTKPEVSKSDDGTWYISWTYDLDFIMLSEKDVKWLLKKIKKAKKKRKRRER